MEESRPGALPVQRRRIRNPDRPGEVSLSLIKLVTDRPGHDQRYAIDCSKIKHDLGWSQLRSFEDGLTETVRWYLNNMHWVDSVRSGDYRKWMAENYENMKR